MHGSAHGTAASIAAMRGRVDGLLVMPPDLKPELLADYLDPALPTVLLNYDAGSLDLPFVAVDNYHGAYAVTEALLARGARDVVHIAGPKYNRDARDRQRGDRKRTRLNSITNAHLVCRLLLDKTKTNYRHHRLFKQNL